MDAYTRCAKGRHAAKPNVADRYACACAKADHTKLLFKGGDFSKADLEPAARPL
jgi:uncharacterized protein with PIN domain